ncbi:MAG: lytic transglycosylase domain-containing protein [Candidatus Binatia bacterium]
MLSRSGCLVIALGLAAIAAAGEITDYSRRGVEWVPRLVIRSRAALRAERNPAPRKAMRLDARRRYDAIIHEYAERYRVDPALVKAVIHVESGFDPRAVSRRGARGLMQLMPVVLRSHGVSDAHDPRENIRAGVRELRSLLDRFRQNRRLAVAAYNAGSGSVRRFGGLPPYRETRRYVARVMKARRHYGAATGRRFSRA